MDAALILQEVQFRRAGMVGTFDQSCTSTTDPPESGDPPTKSAVWNWVVFLGPTFEFPCDVTLLDLSFI